LKKGLFGSQKVVQTYETISWDRKKSAVEGMKTRIGDVVAKKTDYDHQR
jgi:hypothetical protein